MMELTAKHGVTTWKREQAWAGFTLFAPLRMSRNQLADGKHSPVYLMDMNGRFVHSWLVPGQLKMSAELLENGHLLCVVTDGERSGNYPLVFGADRVLELDWKGRIVWQYADEAMDCSDCCRLRNGNTMIMHYEKLPQEVQARVKGGVPGTECKGLTGKGGREDYGWRIAPGEAGTMYTIVLQEITQQGQIVWEMNLAQALNVDQDVIVPFTSRELWPGINAIEEMPDGNILSTSYNLGCVFIWDKENKSVKWRFGQLLGNPSPHRVSFPHDPTVLSDGHILVFDNGKFFGDDHKGQITPDLTVPPNHSRIIEIDPQTNEIVWRYAPENPGDFFSTNLGSARRQPNDNTLICEGATGRFFEVNKRGEIVWEYLSPFYSESKSKYGLTNAVNRCLRYDWDYPGLAENDFDDEKWAALNECFGPEAPFHQIGKRQHGQRGEWK